jgi:hypothetical protein
MHRIVRYTEQLQLAGSYLQEKSHQLARLSLILCDNAVELLAHERCKLYLMKDDRPWMLTSALSNADREAARGQNFDPKVNLLVKRSDMKPDERDYATRTPLVSPTRRDTSHIPYDRVEQLRLAGVMNARPCANVMHVDHEGRWLKVVSSTNWPRASNPGGASHPKIF